ncbi:pentapeptide repeat family protein [Minicystis rosea]|nr:pentapeptide repeat family protein [Minicystis rosea]
MARFVPQNPWERVPEVDISAEGPFAVGSVLWRDARGALLCTLVAKATYGLVPGESAPADVPLPIQEEDVHWDDDPSRSVHVPSDLVPWKSAAEVVVVGSAFAPGERPARSVVARIIVGSVDKAIECFPPRRFRLDGHIDDATPLVRFSLRYEHAAGGPDNPAGVDVTRGDVRGRRSIPPLLPPGFALGGPGDHVPIAAFGPIAATWPSRAAGLGPHDRAWILRPAASPMPPSLATRYFQAAPSDQWLDRALAANERIVLEGLHVKHPRLVMSLSGLDPRAVIVGARAETLRLTGDLLFIDTDRKLCTLTFRGTLAVPEGMARIRAVVTGVPIGTELSADAAREILEAASRDGADPDELLPEPADMVTQTTQMSSTSLFKRPALPFAAPSQPASPPRPGVSDGALPFHAMRQQAFPSPPRPLIGPSGATTMPLSALPPPPPPMAPIAPEMSPLRASNSPVFPGEMPFRASNSTVSSGGTPFEGLNSTVLPGDTPFGASNSTVSSRDTPLGAPNSTVPSRDTPFGASNSTVLPGDTPFGASNSTVSSRDTPFGASNSTVSSGDTPLRASNSTVPSAGTPPPPWGAQGASFGDANAAEKAGARREALSFDAAFGPKPAARKEAASFDAGFGAKAPAGKRSSFDAAFGGVRAASDAAADRERQTEPASPAMASKVVEPALRRLWIVDLLWADPKLPPRLRAMKRFAGVWAAPSAPKRAPQSAAEPRSEPSAAERDRADVLRVLSYAPPDDAAAVHRALADSLEEIVDLEPPLVVVAGELKPTFDELETLKTAVAVAQPVAGTDKKLGAAIAVAQEAIAAPIAPRPDTTLGMARQIEQASGALSLPPRYVAGEVERLLLEGRKYRRRPLLGEPRVRADLVLAGGGDPMTIYLPDAVTNALPLIASFPVVAICAPRPREDVLEAQDEALFVMALGRVLQARGEGAA